MKWVRKAVEIINGSTGNVDVYVKLPKELVEKLDISPGDKFEISLEDGRVVMRRVGGDP
jgi:AbrB family looped-hinge helix DNA binding protein